LVGTVSSVSGTGNPVASGDLINVDVCVSTSNTNPDAPIKVSIAKGTLLEF
jgi:hypothetical protein